MLMLSLQKEHVLVGKRKKSPRAFPSNFFINVVVDAQSQTCIRKDAHEPLPFYGRETCFERK